MNTANRVKIKRLFICLIVFLWIVVIGILIEGGTRVLFSRIALTNPHTSRFLLLHSSNESNIESLWKVPLWEYKPGSVARFDSDIDSWEVRINSLGYRTPEIDLPKPDGTYRIVCVGGSTTMEGWSNESTYPAYLQAYLREHYASDRIEVVNCGISGLKSSGESKKIREYLALDPDMVLEYNCVNDICFNLVPQWRQQFQQDSLVKNLLSRSMFLRHHQRYWLLPDTETLRGDIDQRILTHLNRLAIHARQHHVPTVFISFALPDRRSITAREAQFFDHNLRVTWQSEYLAFDTYCEIVGMYNTQLQQMCHKQGYDFIDLASVFSGGTDTFSDICHLTRAGIQLKARRIADELIPILNNSSHLAERLHYPHSE